MLRKLRMTMLALGSAASLGAAVTPALAEAEYLRLRPLKEPCSVTSGAKCPEVRAPRINKRVSTIPGTQKPDFGRPPVNRNPLGQRPLAPLRMFGNSAISGK